MNLVRIMLGLPARPPPAQVATQRVELATEKMFRAADKLHKELDDIDREPEPLEALMRRIERHRRRN